MTTPWRQAQPWALVVVLLILATQFALPISRLLDDDEASRFGWQMFSGSKAFPELAVQTDEGEIDILLSDYLVRERVEIDVAAVLPPHLCAVVPGAIRVMWDDGEFRCAPG
jgi:hypothetical protein